MDIYQESITEYTFGGYANAIFIIRCWRQEYEVAINDTQKEVIKKLKTLRTELTCTLIAETLITLDRMNAVEVKEQDTKNGVVLYKDWP